MSLSSRSQATLLWILAIIVTLSSVVYQRKTGPTYPVKGEGGINGLQVSYFLPRSQNTGEDAKVILTPMEDGTQATLKWKRFKSHDQWQFTPFISEGANLVAALPSQPPAGKIIYSVQVNTSRVQYNLTEEPVIIRFKGVVPAAVLIPHILFMFTAMFLATRSGLAALVDSPATERYVLVTGILLFLGGLLLGPLVQKYAFDAYWTGWPWGHDLTDNKTAVAFISWLVAFWRIKKTGRAKGWVIAAAIITLLVYLIPHSAFGSELDYTQMES